MQGGERNGSQDKVIPLEFHVHTVHVNRFLHSDPTAPGPETMKTFLWCLTINSGFWCSVAKIFKDRSPHPQSRKLGSFPSTYLTGFLNHGTRRTSQDVC